MEHPCKVIAYAGGGERCPVTREQARMLTHINVSFGTIPMDLSIHHEGVKWLTREAVHRLKQWNPELKILLSLVSSDYNTWTVGASTPEGRRTIAENCVRVMEELDIDGVDFDWEYPCVPSNNIGASPADRHNFTLLLQTVRRTLDQAHPEKENLLTIAAGADVYYCENVELPEIILCLDYINVMTYDIKCGFHALSGHHTNLFCTSGDYFHNSCARALEVFESYGAPREKLLMGAAFYSRKWENVPDRNHGLLQLTKTGGGYGPDYDELAENYVDKNGYVRYWDDQAKAPYLFNGSTFISYDDEQSMAEKCAYIRKMGYGGIFYWNHTNDSTGTLLRAIDRAIKG